VDQRAGLSWTTVAAQLFATTTPTAFTHFRLITTLVGNAGQTAGRGSVQIADLRFYGQYVGDWAAEIISGGSA
jgi:hypothetical protein